MSEAEELGLVESARAGDRLAFERLYRRYASTVHGVLLAMIPPEDARDQVQEVFLSALRAIGRLEQSDRFGAWLMRIAKNHARDALRGRRRTEELPEDVAEPDRALLADVQDEAERILAVIRALPETYRESLTLRLVEGMAGPEIAQRTGMTAGSVRVNLCRGMKLLRERLEEEGLA